MASTSADALDDQYLQEDLELEELEATDSIQVAPEPEIIQTNTKNPKRKREPVDQDEELSSKRLKKVTFHVSSFFSSTDYVNIQKSKKSALQTLKELSRPTTPKEQAERILEKQKLALEGLSAMELEDLKLSEEYFQDSSMVEKKSKPTLADFLIGLKVDKILSKPSTRNGSPHILVVTAAGIRAADLCRSVRSLVFIPCMV
jgi:hypothetical protein